MWLWLMLPVALAFGAGAVLGAPYLPVLSRDTQSLLDLADVRPGELLVDLGSGDGRLLRAAARRGARAIGYEINPVMFAISWLASWRYRSLITVYLGNYWSVKLPDCDVVYVFLIDRYMERLDRKLQAEFKRPARLVSYVFAVPNRQPDAKTHNAFLYHYPRKPF